MARNFGCSRRSRSRPAPPKQGVGVLTARERQVLTLVSKGHENARIASELDIARATVDKHVYNIIGKLGVRNRTHAAVLYWEHLEEQNSKHKAKEEEAHS